MSLSSPAIDHVSFQQRVHEAMASLYGDARAGALVGPFVDLVAAHRNARPDRLRRRDANLPELWYRDPKNAVYVLYADRFSPEAPDGAKLSALRDSLSYFEELGVNILHILPILASTGDDGFAVSDYRHVDGKLGTNEDCVALIQSAHDRGMCVALDFVLNHVADEHAWAKRAKANQPDYVDYFVWDESSSGRAWEGVRDVFSEFAPGHWDYVPERKAHVWATFYKRRPVDAEGRPLPGGPMHPFAQWDLNYANPKVLFEMVGNLLFLANWGVDVFRLDAVPFIWKKRGTPCRGCPEAHAIIRLFRAALSMVAPRTVLLAEANQKYEQVIRFFDGGRGVHLAYQFSLMPALWQAAIWGDEEPMARELAKMSATQEDERPWWWIFTECHDEVGLSTVEGATLSKLWDYFRAGGDGLPFKQEPGSSVPRAVSGTTFSLLHGEVEAIFRLWSLKLRMAAHPLCLGTPLFYMGEELGVENLAIDPAKLRDTRFVKRVPLTLERKARRLCEGTKEHRLFQHLRALLAHRQTLSSG